MPAASDALRRGAHGRLVEGAEHLAVRPGSLVDLESKLARHERGRALVERLVEIRHPYPPQFEHVAEPPRGEQCGRGTLALQDRIGRNRAAVQQLFKCVERRGEFLEQAAHPGNDRVRVVVRGGWKFARGEPPVGREHGDVGEGAADVGGGAGDSRRAGHVQERAPFV